MKSVVLGPVLRPGEAGYAAECTGFNLLVEHRPAVVVGATCAADVQAAVEYASSNGLQIGVVCTGHQPFDPVRGSMMINTGRMGDVEVNPTNATVHVGAGARWQDVVDRAARHDLAPLCGSSPGVAVAGYVLGGGLSPFLGRTFGWAADHVLSLQVATADGCLREVSADSDPDLFWALRGGKSNFGVVTALQLALFPVKEFFGGGLYYAGDSTAVVLQAYRDLTDEAPEEMNSSVALLRLPPLPSVPEPLRGKLVVHVRIAYIGDPEEGARLVAPLRQVAPRVIDDVGLRSFPEFAAVHQEPTDPMPYEERSTLLEKLTPEAVDLLVEAAGPKSGCTVTIVDIRHLGGALARPPAIANAVGNRDAGFVVWGAAVGTHEVNAAPLERIETLIERLSAWGTGLKYLNFISGHDGAELAYAPHTYQRLRELKKVFDPDNTFSQNNHNIPPAA
ncbi:FAD-binding oxidoreductase [Amycolatopsis sp. NPDC051372]|uniref:FAD-binding oxidoreductase n=1 Tax=Amycolatopsis sp. NPDC051372 TaxID=3155669 RepID=UPI0034168293